ncbi:PhnD/SsuA/transferrin family substrate-binding protein [Pseudomonas sp. 7P_10.2_Bac1]|uniref:phosphate/phosphite/phosphonate ABC transporter substrate-binding protein n=1 Tax=Pseudomonas sp. 7P_10.2_Bac1 TaxID=2971614 RepID=UPI0021C80BE4|nr:PhnD/SsuA/transferrin family substrate-binding protein [Pseudomonas sp. 7P_10.2_Bac1]MCU1729060.1 PhnD/SsuA/transferrin family substrate-binding protein [Pseudomonas sp. 7P_10.2_Bac1]
MSGGYAELLMYVAPQPVRDANEQWLTRILDRLQVTRYDAGGLELLALFRSPELVLTQTCGYPLLTQLQGQVQVVGRPRYEWPDSSGGTHCSVIVSRESDSRLELADFKGSRGVINDRHSNSGMNLLRHRLTPLQQDGRFFASVATSGAHQQSLRWVREGWADLASIDSVTFAYLARYAPAEVAGLRIVARTAQSPNLPYITALSAGTAGAERIREAMNLALQELPHVSATLGLQEVLPASEADYQLVIGYQREASAAGYDVLR